MKILVIGSGGQIGRALASVAAAGGHKVAGADLACAGAQFSLDLAETASVGKVMAAAKPELAVLCSAMTRVDGCEGEPELARKMNAEAADALALMCLDAGSKLVYLSTEYVFDGKNGPYSEDDPPNPISVYGRTKLEGERRVLARMRDALSIRTTVVYSFDPGGKNFVMQLVENSRLGREMKVPVDQYSNPTYAPELAGFILELVLAGKSGIYNVVGDDRLGRYEFALKACGALGLRKDILKPVATAELRQPAQRPLNAGLRTEKLRAALGRTPAGPDAHFRTLARLLAGAGGARK